MLSAEEKERIRQEEQYRLAVQEEITKVAEKAKPTSPLGRLVASDNVRWIATSIAIPLAVGLWGLFSTHIADKQHAAQAKEAAAQRQQELSIATGQRNVELVIELLPAFSEPPGTLARLHAIAVMQTLEKFGNLTPELRATLDGGRQQVAGFYDPTKGYTDRGALREAEAYSRGSGVIPANDKDAQEDVQATSLPGAQVYIQIYSENQRDAANAVRRAIRDVGVGAPGIENVVTTAQNNNKPASKGYSKTTLLVFQESALPSARRVADAVTKESGNSVDIQTRWNNKGFANVPLGQLELWFPNPSLKQ